MIAAIKPEPAQLPPTAPPPKLSPTEILMKTVSASRLLCWLQCRLKFYFRYVLQISKPPTPAIHIGSVVHLVLQSWNMARWRKQPFNRNQLQSFFEGHWKEQPDRINWDGKEPGHKSMTWAMLDLYFAQTPIPANEMPEGVEVPVEADLSKHSLPTLVGVMDLVRAGGWIVDFKTSGKSPSAQEAVHLNQTQLAGYSVLYREATGHRESGRELHQLVKTKKPKLIITRLGPMDETQQVRLFRMIESYVEGLAREDFVPSPGFGCAGCEFKNECLRWC